MNRGHCNIYTDISTFVGIRLLNIKIYIIIRYGIDKDNIHSKRIL